MTNPIYTSTRLSFVAVKAGAPMFVGAIASTDTNSRALVPRCAP